MKSGSFVLLLVLTLGIIPSCWSATTPVTPCSAYGIAGSYDVIVVGAGLGGSVAARRLAESNPTWKILLLERGIPFTQCASCQTASGDGLPYEETYSGGFFFTAPQKHVNNLTLFIKDAAVQGGATSINGLVMARGDANRYFPTYWPYNWNYGIMALYYAKSENYTFPPGFYGSVPFSYPLNDRGRDGPVSVEQLGLLPFTKSFLGAIKRVFPNIPVYYNRSLNDGFAPGVGSAPPEVSAIGNYRVDAYTAYISSYKGSNIKSLTNVLVNKITFDGTAASGVNISFYQNATGTNYCTVLSSRVIVSAGAYGTPKLLKLSGVGPAAELAKFNIPVVVDSPAVGANLQDHFVLLNPWTGFPADSDKLNTPNQAANAFYNAEDAGPSAKNNMAYNFDKSGTTPGLITLSTSRLNLNISGTVTLASTDPRAYPIVDPNYFSDESDKTASALAVFKMRQIARLLNLTATSADPCATRDCSTPKATFNAYVAAASVFPGYHFTSTAALCKATNPLSLRLKNTSGLYVLDASIMPQVPAANSQATLYAVAEYGSDLININMHLDSTGRDVAELLGWTVCRN